MSLSGSISISLLMRVLNSDGIQLLKELEDDWYSYAVRNINCAPLYPLYITEELFNKITEEI